MSEGESVIKIASEQRFGAAAILLFISSLLSRLMGLVRDKVISWQFGAGQEADMYFAAFVVPDMINYLLAGGFMSITIIPLLSRAFRESDEEAWRFFSSVLLWITIGALLATMTCMLFSERLAEIVAPGFSSAQKIRLAFFMRIILPAQVFFLCGACFTALLFLRRQFQVPALSPLIYNGAIILGGLLLPAFAAIFLGQSYAEMCERFGMTGYCIGVTIGAFLGAFLLPFFAARKGRLSISFSPWHPLLKRFFWIAMPLMLGQTIIMLDEQFLRVFGSMLESGSVSLLNYARRIAQVPIGLVGQACAVASYPFLVQLLGQGEKQKFAQTLHLAFQSGLCLILPCVAWMCLASEPILRLIFQGGRFSPDDTLACVPLTQTLLLAVPLWLLYMILVRAFYAHEDTKTPAITGTLVTLLAIPFYFWASRMNAISVAATSAVSVSLYILWLVWIFCRRYGSEAFAGLLPLSLKTLLLSLPCLLLSSWSLSLCADISLHPVAKAFVELMVSGSVFGLLFLTMVYFWHPELRTLLAGRIRFFARKKEGHGED